MKSGIGHRRVMALAVACACANAAGATAPAERYSVLGDTVVDTQTRLVWQRKVPVDLYTWAEAKGYCAGVGSDLGGAGWRLPTMKELQTIIDDSRTDPAVDPTAFPNTPSEPFWSSSPVIDSPSYAWNVYFYNGSTYSADAMYPFRVRCVH